MPLITGNIRGGDGAAIEAVLRFQSLSSAAALASGAIPSRAVIMSTAAALADPGVTLAPGKWLLTWSAGTMVSRLVLDVPDDSDPYTLPEVIGGPQVPTRGWYETFATVAEMVESQNSWQFAECSNYEPDDGWWSLWTRTAETGLDPSTDPTVLALDGGGFVRRIQPSA